MGYINRQTVTHLSVTVLSCYKMTIDSQSKRSHYIWIVTVLSCIKSETIDINPNSHTFWKSAESPKLYKKSWSSGIEVNFGNPTVLAFVVTETGSCIENNNRTSIKRRHTFVVTVVSCIRIMNRHSIQTVTHRKSSSVVSCHKITIDSQSVEYSLDVWIVTVVSCIK